MTRRVPRLAVALALLLVLYFALGRLASDVDLMSALVGARHGRFAPLAALAAFMLLRVTVFLLVPGLLLGRLGLTVADRFSSRPRA